MGNKKQKQLILLCILLLAAAFGVYRAHDVSDTNKSVPLQEMLGPVPGYKLISSAPLRAEVASFLVLDDYTQSLYGKNGKRVSLYIGYYYNLEKLSAAHSPLVCFPGQGWKLEQNKKRQLHVGDYTVNFEEMVGELDGRQELIIYWYQAEQKTTPEVYRNKINGVLNKLMGKKEEHAFVRVTVPFEKDDKKQAEKDAREFISNFYPIFLDYIKS